MPNAPSIANQAKGVVHSGDNPVIIDYPSYISVREWGGCQSTAQGVSPILTFPPLGTGVAQGYGTGTADDSRAVNAALLAIGLGNSGISLFFPAGTYLVTDTAIVNTYNVPIILAPGAIITGTYAATLMNQGQPYKVRAVMTAITTSTTYTGTGTNTLTMGSNAILFGTQDGVTTLAVGDAVLLPGGTLSGCAITAADSGPWLISALGAAGAKGVLVRPQWWLAGQKINPLQQIAVGPEGTLFGGTTWSSWAGTPIGTPKIVGTDDPLFYPDQVATQVTFATTNIYTMVTVPIRSATLTTIQVSSIAAAGTRVGTCGYNVITAPTAGYLTTASFVISATTTAMSLNTSDASSSIVNVVITNRAAAG